MQMEMPFHACARLSDEPRDPGPHPWILYTLLYIVMETLQLWVSEGFGNGEIILNQAGPSM